MPGGPAAHRELFSECLGSYLEADKHTNNSVGSLLWLACHSERRDIFVFAAWLPIKPPFQSIRQFPICEKAFEDRFHCVTLWGCCIKDWLVRKHSSLTQKRWELLWLRLKVLLLLFFSTKLYIISWQVVFYCTDMNIYNPSFFFLLKKLFIACYMTDI